MAPVVWMMAKAPPQMKMKKMISAACFIPLGTDSKVEERHGGLLHVVIRLGGDHGPSRLFILHSVVDSCGKT
jgi:hypothetical protein